MLHSGQIEETAVQGTTSCRNKDHRKQYASDCDESSMAPGCGGCSTWHSNKQWLEAAGMATATWAGYCKKAGESVQPPHKQ